jgi:hypothetical protein
MGRTIVSSDPRAELRRQRYRIMRQMSVPTDVARFACKSPGRFVQSLHVIGKDERDYPAELSTIHLGGHPRTGSKDERDRRRKEWYRSLRDLGASAAFATQYCKGRAAFMRGKHALEWVRKEAAE